MSQIRHGTSDQWSDSNPTLEEGEIGVESDTKKAKVGPGVWSSLPYLGVGGSWDDIEDKPENLVTGYANGTPVAWKLDVLSEEQYQELSEPDPGTVYFRLG